MEMQGWLHVCDIRGVPAHQLSCGHPVPTVWMEKYCYLSEGKIWLLEPDVSNQFCNGDDSARMISSRSAHSLHTESVQQGAPQDSLINGTGAGTNGMGELQMPFHVLSDPVNKSFLQRKMPPAFYRSKSATGKENQTHGENAPSFARNVSISKQLSEFGGLAPTLETPDMLDLQAQTDAIVRPLHYSILGRAHCFEVVTTSGSRCFCCRSAGERESWIEKLKRTLNPNLENSRRMEYQLSLWVQEAKGIPVRKKYFCEICLDRQLYARTTSKYKEDNTIFWGEYFDFTSIPCVENVTIHLYKDSDKKRKREKDYFGLINISVKSMENRKAHEKWYIISTPSGKNKSNSGETMAMRVKVHFQSFSILPMQQYKELGEFVSCHYMLLTRAAQSALTVSKKDELSRILVYIMHATGSTKEFMTEIVMDDITNIEEESLIFRENTIATKAVEHFLKLVGMNYLQETLGDFVKALYESEDDCEVDGSRLPLSGVLEHNQKNLQMCCEIAMFKILNSIKIFPNELCEVFSKWREHCEQWKRPRIASKLITASLFLRLLCPAILNPYLFGLTNELPQPTAARTLTLVAKVIQNLANRSRFGDKEEYMKFMNGFVREQWDQMGKFLNDVTECNKMSVNGFEGYIDLGKELAKLHAFLIENLQEFEPSILDKLSNLREVLASISKRIHGNSVDAPLRSTAKIDHPEKKNLEVISSMESVTIDARLSSATEAVGEVGDQGRGVGAKYGKMQHLENTLLEASAEGLEVKQSIRSEENTVSGSFNNSNNSGPGHSESVANLTDKSTPSLSYSSKHPLSFSNPAYLQPHLMDNKLGVNSPNFIGDFHYYKVDSSVGQYSELLPGIVPVEDPKTSTANTVAKKSTALDNSFNSASPIAFTNPLQRLMPAAISGNVGKDSSQTKLKSWYKPIFDETMQNQSSSDAESGSSNKKHTDEDSLSSRPSSTSSDSSSETGNLNIKQNKEKTGPGKLPKSRSHNDSLQNTLPGEDAGCKLTAVATSTSVSISSARHCTGLKKRQLQNVNAKPHEKTGARESPKLSALPVAAPSCNTCPQHFAEIKTTPQKLNHSKFVIPVNQSFTNTRHTDNVADREYGTRQSVSRKHSAAFAPSFNSSRSKIPHKGKINSTFNNNSKTQGPAAPFEDVQRNSHRRTKRSSSASAQLVSSHISTPEDIMSAEERTAQWVLSSMVPVPKDEIVHPANVPSADNPKYNELVSCLKIDLDTLSSRLRVAEHSGKAFTKREEALLDQLKESDVREARLLERLRVVEERVAHHAQGRKDKKNELADRFPSTAESKRGMEPGLQDVINEKNAIVSMQRKRIAYLEETNNRLLRKIKEMKTHEKVESLKSNSSPVTSLDRHDVSVSGNKPPSDHYQSSAHTNPLKASLADK